MKLFQSNKHCEGGKKNPDRIEHKEFMGFGDLEEDQGKTSVRGSATATPT